MKLNHIRSAFLLAICGSSLLLSSCVYEVPTYGGSYYNDAAVWTAASYDAAGFPIFGYYGGRPVYGYTASGVAVFSFGALTVSCSVPLWGPAPWYHGHWHYPHHIHRVSVPPHFPHGHCPAMRPHGGLNAPIHKEPHKVLPRHAAPARVPGHREAAAQRPAMHHAAGGSSRHENHRMQPAMRPSADVRHATQAEHRAPQHQGAHGLAQPALPVDRASSRLPHGGGAQSVERRSRHDASPHHASAPVMNPAVAGAAAPQVHRAAAVPSHAAGRSFAAPSAAAAPQNVSHGASHAPGGAMAAPQHHGHHGGRGR